MNRLSTIFAATALVTLSSVSHAGPITADFRLEANLPTVGSGQAKVYEALDQTLTSGYELTGADLTENPSGWGGGEVWMNFDPTTHQLTLDSRDTMDFQTLDAWVNNILFDTAEVISGIFLVSNNLTTPFLNPSWAFTDNSLHIAFNSVPDDFDFTQGSAVFQIETRSNAVSVPEPGTLSLMGLAVALILVAQARRRQQ